MHLSFCRPFSRHWPAALLALVLAALVGTIVHAETAPSVVVIFDGSGSMWGAIEGGKGSKMTLAREALRRGLGKVAPQTRVGLASFGHRRGDCVDVEILRPPEPLDVQRLLEPLEKLNPKGRGPLTQALRDAGKALGAGPGRRSLVLIHDDADNCQQDVCAAASELKAAGITAHVVGLGVKAEDAPKMACVPQVTGGRLINAQNADQIGAALEEVLRLAGADAGPEPPAPPSERPPGPSAAPVPEQGPPGLYLRALLAPGTEPVSWPLQWSVFAEGQTSVALFAARAANPHVPVAPGRYVVEARDGAVAVSQTVEVAEKAPTAVNLVLNAGTLRVRAIAPRSGAAFGDAVITIVDAGQVGDGRKDAVAAALALFKGGEGQAMLPAGRYVVRAEQGLVRNERSVVVPAGSQGRVDVPLNAARLQLSASGRDSGGPLDTLVFSVAEDDPDAPRGRREIARSAARQAEFVLPPGTYYVLARLGSVEARERLAIGPGDVVRRMLSVAAGRLVLATKPLGAAPAQGEPVSYRIERIDAPGEAVITSRPAPVLMLPSGRYRVEGRYGLMNARVVREVEIKAGQAQQLTLEHEAAVLRLRLAGRGAAPAEVAWDIRDEAGGTVWTTGQPEPSATLQAGRYIVRAELRDKRYERAIELRGGESRLLEIAAD